MIEISVSEKKYVARQAETSADSSIEDEPVGQPVRSVVIGHKLYLISPTIHGTFIARTEEGGVLDYGRCPKVQDVERLCDLPSGT